MATSSKVQFKLGTLRRKAIEAIDSRIEAKKLEVASYEDPEVLVQHVEQWRKTQQGRISQLFYRLGDGNITDAELARFKLDEFPTADRHERSRSERELRILESTRAQVLAKAESLVADAEGNIALTKTQLAEFFGL